MYRKARLMGSAMRKMGVYLGLLEDTGYDGFTIAAVCERVNSSCRSRSVSIDCCCCCMRSCCCCIC